MNIYGLLALCSTVLIWVVLELIRNKKMAEKYSLLWIGAGLVMLVSGICPGVVHTLAAVLDILYAPTLLLLTGLLLVIAILLYLTIVISRLEKQQIRLVQELALLKARRDRKDGVEEDNEGEPRVGRQQADTG